MKVRISLLALAMLTVATAPSYAIYCQGGEDDYGISSSGSFQFGGRYDEQQRMQFDEMRLKQIGVAVTRAERWNGCIRAFVDKPEGGEEMQYFDPNSLRRLQ